MGKSEKNSFTSPAKREQVSETESSSSDNDEEKNSNISASKVKLQTRYSSSDLEDNKSKSTIKNERPKSKHIGKTASTSDDENSDSSGKTIGESHRKKTNSGKMQVSSITKSKKKITKSSEETEESSSSSEPDVLKGAFLGSMKPKVKKNLPEKKTSRSQENRLSKVHTSSDDSSDDEKKYSNTNKTPPKPRKKQTSSITKNASIIESNSVESTVISTLNMSKTKQKFNISATEVSQEAAPSENHERNKTASNQKQESSPVTFSNKVQILQNVKLTRKSPDEILQEWYPNITPVKLSTVVNKTDDDEEVFFLRIPKTVNPQNLLHKQIDLMQPTKIKIENEKYVFEPTNKTLAPFLLVDGQKNTLIQPINTLYLKKIVKPPKMPLLESSLRDPISLPESLKPRHPLFGSNYEEKIHLSDDIQRRLDKAIQEIIKREEKLKKPKKKNPVTQNEVIFTLLDNHTRSLPQKNEEQYDSAFGSSDSFNSVVKKKRKHVVEEHIAESANEDLYQTKNQNKNKDSFNESVKIEATDQTDYSVSLNQSSINRCPDNSLAKKQKKMKNKLIPVAEEFYDTKIVEDYDNSYQKKKKKKNKDKDSFSGETKMEDIDYTDQSVSLNQSSFISPNSFAKKKKKKERSSRSVGEEQMLESTRTDVESISGGHAGKMFVADEFHNTQVAEDQEDSYRKKKLKKSKDSYSDEFNIEGINTTSISDNSQSNIVFPSEDSFTNTQKRKSKKRTTNSLGGEAMFESTRLDVENEKSYIEETLRKVKTELLTEYETDGTSGISKKKKKKKRISPENIFNKEVDAGILNNIKQETMSEYGDTNPRKRSKSMLRDEYVDDTLTTRSSGEFMTEEHATRPIKRSKSMLRDEYVESALSTKSSGEFMIEEYGSRPVKRSKSMLRDSYVADALSTNSGGKFVTEYETDGGVDSLKKKKKKVLKSYQSVENDVTIDDNVLSNIKQEIANDFGSLCLQKRTQSMVDEDGFVSDALSTKSTKSLKAIRKRIKAEGRYS